MKQVGLVNILMRYLFVHIWLLLFSIVQFNVYHVVYHK